MKAELDLVRSGRPPREESLTPRMQPTAPARKAIREITDAVIHDSLLVNNLPALVKTTAALMLAVAEAVDDFDIEPGVDEFVGAAQGLVEAARSTLDRGLLVTNWAQAKTGAVMLELTVRGICAALSVPYDDVLREVHRASLAGDEADVQGILARAGLIQLQETTE